MNPSIIDTLPIPGAKQPSAAGNSVSPMRAANSVMPLPTSAATNTTGTPGPASPPSVGSTTRAETDGDFQKKWVSAVKVIIMRTKHDPYLQSNELNKAGREYREELQARG